MGGRAARSRRRSVLPVWLAARTLGGARTHIKKIRYNVTRHLFFR